MGLQAAGAMAQAADTRGLAVLQTAPTAAAEEEPGTERRVRRFQETAEPENSCCFGGNN